MVTGIIFLRVSQTEGKNERGDGEREREERERERERGGGRRKDAVE